MALFTQFLKANNLAVHVCARAIPESQDTRVVLTLIENNGDLPCHIVRKLTTLDEDGDHMLEGGVAMWSIKLIKYDSVQSAELRAWESMYNSLFEVRMSPDERKDTLTISILGVNKEWIIDRTLERDIVTQL